MHAAAPSSPPDAAGLIGEARQLSAGLVAFVFNQLDAAAAGTLGRPLLLTFLRTVIKPCEALIRRAIYLLAARMPPASPPAIRAATSRKTPAPPPPGPRPPFSRIPAFRLTEPVGRRARRPAPLKSASGTAPPAITPEQFNQRFLMRLAALRAACADPDRCALRLRRRLARTRPAVRPLKPAPPPGLKAARLDRIKSLFADLEAATCAAWPRLSDTS